MKYNVYIKLENGDEFIGEAELLDDFNYAEFKLDLLKDILSNYPKEVILTSVIEYILTECKEGEEQISHLTIDDILNTI